VWSARSTAEELIHLRNDGSPPVVFTILLDVLKAVFVFYREIL
jgi:hypothetical protein